MSPRLNRDGAATPATELRDVQMMRALGSIADTVVRQHDTAPHADVPDLPPGLAGQPRRSVFEYHGLASTPDEMRADVRAHDLHRSGSRSLPALTLLAEAMDGAWAGDEAATRAALVELGADVVRWIQAIDTRTGAGS